MTFESLSINSLKTLRDLLRANLPQTTMVLNSVEMILSGKYGTYLVDDYVQVLTYNGNVDDFNSLFLLIDIRPPELVSITMVFTPISVTTEMVDAFAKFFDWRKSQDLCVLSHSFVQHIETIAKEKGGTMGGGVAADLYLPIEKALNFDLSRKEFEDEFEIDKLSPEHWSKVKSFWKYGKETNEELLTSTIKRYGCAGVFRKIKDPTGSTTCSSRHVDDLVSWVIVTRVGTLNALHTLDNYRRRGLAAWTMEACSKWLAEEGLIPICEIEPYNKASRKLVENLGFKFVSDTHWMSYKSQSDNV